MFCFGYIFIFVTSLVWYNTCTKIVDKKFHNIILDFSLLHKTSSFRWLTKNTIFNGNIYICSCHVSVSIFMCLLLNDIVELIKCGKDLKKLLFSFKCVKTDIKLFFYIAFQYCLDIFLHHNDNFFPYFVIIWCYSMIVAWSGL